MASTVNVNCVDNNGQCYLLDFTTNGVTGFELSAGQEITIDYCLDNHDITLDFQDSSFELDGNEYTLTGLDIIPNDSDIRGVFMVSSNVTISDNFNVASRLKLSNGNWNDFISTNVQAVKINYGGGNARNITIGELIPDSMPIGLTSNPDDNQFQCVGGGASDLQNASVTYTTWYDQVQMTSVTGGCNLVTVGPSIPTPDTSSISSWICQGEVVTAVWEITSGCCEQTIFSRTFEFSLPNELGSVRDFPMCTVQCNGAPPPDVTAEFQSWLDQYVDQIMPENDITGGCGAYTVSVTTGPDPVPTQFCNYQEIDVTAHYVDECGQTFDCIGQFKVLAPEMLIFSDNPSLATVSSCPGNDVTQSYLDYVDSITVSGACGDTSKDVQPPEFPGGWLPDGITLDNLECLTVDFCCDLTVTFTDECGATASQMFEFCIKVPEQLTCQLDAPNNQTFGPCNFDEKTLNENVALWLEEIKESTAVVSGGCDPSVCYRLTTNYPITVDSMVLDPLDATIGNPCDITTYFQYEILDDGSYFSNYDGNFPKPCGGTITFYYTFKDDNCPEEVIETIEKSRFFEVVEAPEITVNNPIELVTVRCQGISSDLQDISVAYQQWYQDVEATTISGGCDTVIEKKGFDELPGNPTEEMLCIWSSNGETLTVDFCVDSSCTDPTVYSTAFVFLQPEALTVTALDPQNQTISCATNLTEISVSFNNWVDTVSVSGGCGVHERTLYTSPDINGLDETVNCVTEDLTIDTTVQWSDECQNTTQVIGVFTIMAPPTIDCQVGSDNVTISACPELDILQTVYNGWVDGIYNGVTVNGWCNPTFSFSPEVPPPAPERCGGVSSVTVEFTDILCSNFYKSLVRTFTVETQPDLEVAIPDDIIIDECLPQSEIWDLYKEWSTDITITNNCDEPTVTSIVSPTIGWDMTVEIGQMYTRNVTVSDACDTITVGSTFIVQDMSESPWIDCLSFFKWCTNYTFKNPRQYIEELCCLAEHFRTLEGLAYYCRLFRDSQKEVKTAQFKGEVKGLLALIEDLRINLELDEQRFNEKRVDFDKPSWTVCRAFVCLWKYFITASTLVVLDNECKKITDLTRVKYAKYYGVKNSNCCYYMNEFEHLKQA